MEHLHLSETSMNTLYRKLQTASDCVSSEGILLSDALQDKSQSFYKLLKAHVSSNPNWYASQRAKHAKWLKEVARHVGEHAEKLLSKPKQDNLYRCCNCCSPLMVPSSNRAAQELGFWWSSDQLEATGDPQNIQMILCQICLEMSRIHQHNRSILDWAAALYCVHAQLRGVQQHLQDVRPIYTDSIARMGREEMTPIDCTIELALLKAQFELQRGMVVYPTPGNEKQSLWKHQWRTVQVLQKKRLPHKRETQHPIQECERHMDVDSMGSLADVASLPPLDPLWLTWDENKQRQECIPWLNSNHYLFVYVPLAIQKHSSPLTAWATVARDPSHPVSNNNFIITTQFLKLAEEHFGRSAVLKWIHFHSYYGDSSNEMTKFVTTQFRSTSTSGLCLGIHDQWPTTLAEKRKALDEYALLLNSNKRMKEEKKAMDQRLVEERRVIFEPGHQNNDEEHSAMMRKMHLLLSILATSQSGIMVMELLGLQFEYCWRRQQTAGPFKSLQDSDAAYVLSVLLRKHHLVPLGSGSQNEEQHFILLILRLLQSFRDSSTLEYYLESNKERRIKHVHKTEHRE